MTVRGGSSVWTSYQKIAFRIAFVFFAGMCIPTKWEWYEGVLHIDWTNLHFRDIYHIARFEPGFVKIPADARWGIGGFTNWGILLLFSIAAGLIWTFIDRKRTEYNILYYWLRVIVRYRTAIGIIGFCWEKVFPTQMPYPSISMLSNNLGDYTPYKIYWLSIGIVPWYETFAGLLELTVGVLLFFRSTVAWGSALLIGPLLTVAVVNVGYGNASHVYSMYFVFAGLLLLTSDLKKVYELFILERYTIPYPYYVPAFKLQWQKLSRYILKGSVLGLFVVVMGYLVLLNFLYDPYKQPSVSGVKQLKGYYDVTEFKVNGKQILYSPSDTTIWQEVIFEKWPSFAIRVNKPIQVDVTNGGGYDKDHSMRNIGRAFELSGAAGGRKIFHYYADTITHTLYLLDKNIPHRNLKANGTHPKDTIYPDDWISADAWKHIGDERTSINARAGSALRDHSYADPEGKEVDKERQKMILHYSIENNGSSVVLSGTNEYKDSIYVKLIRSDRAFSLSESNIEAGNYDR